jgi:hypothetical protein
MKHPLGRNISVGNIGDNFLKDAAARVPARDKERPIKVLKSRSELKTKDYFHRCGFSEQEGQSTEGKGSLEGLGHGKGGGAHSLPSLSQVLNEDDGPTREQMLHVLRTFAEDYGSVATSIDRVDVEGLDRELQSLPPERSRVGVRTRQRQLRSAAIDVNAGCRWPSIEVFEKHYKMPHSAQRVLEQSWGSTRKEFKSEFSSVVDSPVVERRTIARIEDALSPEELAMLPPMEDEKIATPATLPSVDDQNQTVRIFEASEVYQQVCDKFGLHPLAPVPFFGDTVEIDAPVWGARHCYAIAAAIRMCAPRELVLKNNLLTDTGAAKILEMVLASPRADKVHFEGSSLSYKAMNALYVASKGNFTVSGLYFRACGLGTNIDLDDLPDESQAYEECMADLFAEVYFDRAQTPSVLPLLGVAARALTIRQLDVSNNIFTDEAWACFLPLLKETHMEKLYIDNCLLENRSALILAEGLECNTALLELRMRQNALQGPSSWRVIFQALASHQRMSHFDCAENNLTCDVVDSICACLKQCQTMVSMHLLEMDRDAGVRKALLVQMGLIPKDSEITSSDLQELVIWRAPHVKSLGNKWHACGHEAPSKGPAVDASLPSGCWICEKRAAHWFKWVIPESGPGMIGEGGQLFVLPSFAGFSRVELQRAPATSGKSIVFAQDMLVPPGTHFYVFEFGAGSNAADRQSPLGLQCAKDQASIELETALAKLEDEAQRKARLFFKTRGYTGRVNTFQLSGDGFQIPEGAFDKKDEPLVPISMDKSRKDEAEWKHRLRKCFEADIQHVRMQDLCHSDEQPHLEAIIWSRYSSLYEVYAIFAGRSTFPFIRQMDIYDFFEAADVMEKLKYEDSEGEEASKEVRRPLQDPMSRQLTLQDMQQLLMQTMSHGSGAAKATLNHQASSGLGSKKQQEMSEKRAQVAQKAKEGRPLARPQFLELILRLAICLFGRDVQNTMSECLKIFVDRVLVERILRPPLAPFPKALMWTSEVNSVFIEHTQTLHLAHERFGRNANSFIQLAQLMKLYDKTFTAKNVCSLFALARQPHVDAWETKGTRGLTFAEFCEALVRFSLVRRNQNEQNSIFKDLSALSKAKEETKGRGFHSIMMQKPDSPDKPPSSGGNSKSTALGGLVSSKLRDQVRRQMGSEPQAVRHRRFAAHVSRFLSKLKERMKAPKILGA